MSSINEKMPLIYCGPTLPRGVLTQHTVYRGGFPAHLNKYFEQCPAIKRLFVPASDLNKTMLAISKTGSAENVWFGQIIECFKGGVSR